MVREYLQKIKENIDVRKNLIDLKAAIADQTKKHAMLYALGNEFGIFYKLLEAEDPKIRKNAAQILGKIGNKESLDYLYQAYEREDKLFVRGSYLAAMKEMDYRKYLDRFKERLEEVQFYESKEEEKKHRNEEIKLLRELVTAIEGTKRHTFTGYEKVTKIVLLTNRNYQNVTFEQMKSHRAKVFGAGVMARTSDLKDILPIRTYTELLFVLEDKNVLQIHSKKVKDQATELANQIIDSSLVTFLKERHKENAPFLFRIECKGAMDRKEKSILTKTMAQIIEEGTKGELVNSTSHYEIELRLIPNKEGNYNFLVKLFTIPDERFSYRRNAIASSIHPVNAALVMELAKDYLTEGAQVLDPFCGVGTMLVERQKVLPVGDMYGIDIYGKGIEAARENTALANIRVNYINRDFFDFTHEYLFDELITNMPRIMGQKDKKEITCIYKEFWKKAKEHLKINGILVLFTYDRDILKQTLRKEWYTILEEFEISRKEGAYLFVCRRIDEV